LHSLVDGVSRFIMATIAGKGFIEVQANVLTGTCQNPDPQNPCKQGAAADEGEISTITEAQNPYKLPLNSELTAFTKKPDESAINVIGYQYRLNHNR
jgi:hypothetical protein